jgi:hypothetical protein
MIDQKMLENIPCGTSHISARIDGIADLVHEAFHELGLTVTTSSVAATTQVFNYLITKAPDHPAVQNMADTLDHSILAIVSNRSTESMTSLAKRHINPSTGQPYTRASISKKALELADRLGIQFRAGKSETARKSYEQRARRIHDRRRRETPKFKIGALMKGLKWKQKQNSK